MKLNGKAKLVLVVSFVVIVLLGNGCRTSYYQDSKPPYHDWDDSHYDESDYYKYKRIPIYE